MLPSQRSAVARSASPKEKRAPPRRSGFDADAGGRLLAPVHRDTAGLALTPSRLLRLGGKTGRADFTAEHRAASASLVSCNARDVWAALK